MTQPEEQSLIDRCKKGDIASFDLLVRHYEKRVFNFAYRLSGNQADAEDVAQEAFIRVFNSIATFRGDANFSTWVFKIVTNVYLDERKRSKAHQTMPLDEYIELEEDTVSRQIEDTGPTPDVIVQERERDQILQNAIQCLPEYQRAMVVLYHTHSKTYEEIAEIMNLPIGTVKSRLNRARLALKEKLGPLRELFEI